MNLQQRLIQSMLPRKAIVFHHRVGRSPEKAVRYAEQARALAQKLGLRKLFVLHGNAFDCSAGTCLVLGPHGIGKTSAVVELERAGKANLLEEGFVIIGKNALGGLRLVSTGSIGFYGRKARLARSLRFITSFESKYLLGGREWGIVRKTVHGLMQEASRVIALISPREAHKTHIPKLLPIVKVLVFDHPHFHPHGIEFAGAGPKPVSLQEIEELFSGGRVQHETVFSGDLNVHGVIKKIKQMANEKTSSS